MRGIAAALAVAFASSACGPAGSGSGFVLDRRSDHAVASSGDDSWTAKDSAERIRNLERRLTRKLERWTQEGRPRKGELWRSLQLLGLKVQKYYRRMVSRKKFSKKVAGHLDGAVGWRFRAHMRAGRRLKQLSSPVDGPVHMPTTKPAHPRRLMSFYRKAQRRYAVPWYILASVNLIETRCGRLTGPSSAGALGPMQFMPATWDAYGNGDIMDPHDSIMAAARYLAANGAPDDMRNALWHYNHSWAYVDAIQIYARQMKWKTRNYYKYYLWQAFVRTTDGDLQITGPGS